MCSQLSRRRMPTCAEHADALRGALLEVTQESYFSFVEPCDRARFDQVRTEFASGPDGRPARWLRAEVNFSGAFAGRVSVTMPYTLASVLLANFAGLLPGEAIVEDHVIDSTGEFANMVCGTWLTRDCGRRRFDLEPPRVVDVDATAAAAGDQHDQLLLVDDQPIRLELAFRPA